MKQWWSSIVAYRPTDNANNICRPSN